jgi:hypothetical protein
MYRARQIQKVLELLARNVATSIEPGLVESMRIASELDLSVAETKQLLKIMHEMGIIESNMEMDYSLITRAGLDSLTPCYDTPQAFRRSCGCGGAPVRSPPGAFLFLGSPP